MENKEDLITTQDVFCTSCGTKNNKENIFCSSCGKELKKDENKEEKELLISENNNGKFKLSKESYLVFGLGVIISLFLADDGGLLFFGFLIVCFLFYVKSQKKIQSKVNNNDLGKVVAKDKKKRHHLSRDSIILLILLAVLSIFFLGPFGLFLFLLLFLIVGFPDETIVFFSLMQKLILIVGVVMLILLGTCLIPIFFSS